MAKKYKLTPRLTVHTKNPEAVMLFPDSYSKMTMHKDESDIVLRYSPELWQLIEKCTKCEDIEEKMGKPIEQIADEAYRARNLSTRELRIAHDKYELILRESDAKRHCKILFPNEKLKKEDYKTLAKAFIKEYDCNIAENDMWVNIITNYVLGNH